MIFYTVLLVILAIITIYILLIIPNTSRRKETMTFAEYYYAHRGLYDNNSDSPENTMKAFKKAVKANYGIELDVHVTKDGYCVVAHDDSLKRITGVDRNISDMTYNEIKKLKVYNSEQTIPRFEDVLKLVNGAVPLVIEIKSSSNTYKETEIIDKVLCKYEGKYCLESFNPLVLMWYKVNRPEVIRGQLSSNLFRDEKKHKLRNLALTYMLTNFLTKPDFIAYNLKYPHNLSFVLTTKVFRAVPYAWTVRTEEQLEKARKNFKVFIFEHIIPTK